MRFFLSFAMLACAFLAGCEMTDEKIDWIGTERATEIHNRREDDPRAALFVDPRPAESFESAHIAGAINRSLATFDGEKGIDPRISRFQSIVVYGQNPGDKSVTAVAKRLLTIGYSGVYAYSGGIEEWTSARLPTQSGPGAELPPIEESTRRGINR